MSLFYKFGAFLFYFGIISAVLSVFFIATFSAIAVSRGLEIPSVINDMARMFGLSAVIGGLLGLLSGRILGSFLPSMNQVIGISFILTYFLPIYTSVCGVLGTIIQYLPVDTVVKISLIGIVNSFSAFALIYYIGVKVGAVPVM